MRLRCLLDHSWDRVTRPDGREAWFCRECGKEGPVRIHTIPVPRGWSVEQSWEAIRRGDLLTDPVPLWANVEVDPRGRMVRVSEAPVDPA